MDDGGAKIKIKRVCKHCLFHYIIDLEGKEQCFQKGGCIHFSPIGLRITDTVEIVEE